jgi:pilus assembly protein CpaC
MHPTPRARRPRPWWGLTLAAGLVGSAALAQPPTPTPGQDAPKEAGKGAPIPDARTDPKTGAVIVPVGGLVRFDPKLPAPPADIVVSREGVLDWKLDPDAPGVLRLTGRAPGLVQLTIATRDQPPVRFDVVVQPDYDLLRSLIRRAVPTANVEVDPGVGNVIILSGYATSPQDADTVQRLAASQVGGAANVINAVQVGGVQHVQLDVVIASVDRNELRSRGFDFNVVGRTVDFQSLVSGLLTPLATGGAGGGGGGGAGGGGLGFTVSPEANLQLGIAPAGFFGALRALRTEGLAKFLAEPRLITQSGRPAYFLSGGRQAVISPSSGITGPGVQYEQVGTELEFLPIVYGNNQIWLEVNPIVRAVNQGLGITTSFGTVPGFTEQQARCAVMLESGQTFAIGGLIQSSVQASASRVPVLGDLPYVGTLFSRVQYDERESELVILVTPRLVAPMDCNQVPRRLPGRETRGPDDYELFLEGLLEAPRGQRRVWNGRCYQAAYKSDPSVTGVMGWAPPPAVVAPGPVVVPSAAPAPAAPPTPTPPPGE